MIALSATEGFRSEGGTCAGPASVVERTADAGKTWQPVAVPKDTVQKVIALGNSGGGVWSVAAAGADCTPNYWSMSQGGTWEPSKEALAQTAYAEPSGASIHFAQGTEPAPCGPVLRVAVRPEGGAAVLCPDGIWGRGPLATTWTHAALTGVSDLSAGRTGYLLAYSDPANCSGVSFGSLPAVFTASAAPAFIGCVASAAAPVTLTSSGATVWLWAGANTLTSLDGGRTWSR